MEVLSQNFPDRSCAFKGKRTKRSRPSSPVNTAGTMMIVTSTSSSVAGGSDDDDTGGGAGGDTGGDFYDSTSIQYSPTTSTNQISTTSTSEEDEDMANCLILLAQSGCGHKVNKKEKISSRKFAEITTYDNSTNGKAGVYVYECKTCNRTFPSFQALGGHRASHKKPKTIVEEIKKTVSMNTDSATATATAAGTVVAAVSHDSHDHQEQGRLNKITNQTVVNNNNKTKIHECSICGSEFSSGQALGGHMRRHRPPPTTMTTSTTHNNVSDTSSSHHKEKSTRNMLSLDLNLPAPPEDDHKYEQSLVFTTPLVDCYY